jgi:hypothetical protein
MFIRLGNPFDINMLHVIGDVQYPAGWFLNGENRAAHGVTEVADPPPVPVVPQEVTRRRGLQALLISGVTEAMIEAAIEAALTGLQRELALIEFRTSQTFERTRPLVIAIGGAMGLDLDELFILAASLP